MTKSGLLSGAEALEILGLYDPDKGFKANTRYLKKLADRGLLPRFKVSGCEFKYELKDVQKLLKRAKEEGLRLT